MHRKRFLPGSMLAFLFLVLLLFGAFALAPVWAQGPEQEQAPADEPSASIDISAQALVPSSTGYLIDDGEPGFTQTLTPDGWLTWPAGYGGDFRYTNVTVGTSGDYAQWKPDLATARYEVLVYYIPDPNRRTDAEYVISHAGSVDTVRISQQGPAGPGIWLSLGQYLFDSGGVDYVRLTDDPEPWGTGTYVIADAVKFAPLNVYVDDDYTAINSGPHLWGVDAFDNIEDGLDAVAEGGRVRVLAGTYYRGAPIQLTKGITLAGTSPASTRLYMLPGVDTAIELLADNAHVSGFTIEGNGTTTYGIRNYDTVAASWVFNISNYGISENVIYECDYGVRMRRSSGMIEDNEIHDNTYTGIWVQQPETVSPGPTMISGNELYGNGSGATDYDIRLEDAYAGSEVAGNTITGSGALSEVAILVQDAAGATTVDQNVVTGATIGIYVRDNANGVVVSGNTLSGCSEGLRVWQVSIPALTVQTVDVFGNSITGGTVGILAGRDVGTTGSARTLTVGGSVANANSIYNNGTAAGNDELRLDRFSWNVDASYNDWGVCTLRKIEDEIRHDPDLASLGLVTYEPALCVPYGITVVATPASLPADGAATAMITATVVDVAGNWAQPGTMIGIVSSLGSVPYGYAEAEGPGVTVAGAWSSPVLACASGGQVMRSANPAHSLSWSFTGQAVSLVYAKRPTSGSADVYVDGSLVTTINMASPSVNEYRVEDIISTWPAVGAHVIEVRPVGGAAVDIDAFRSGGLVASQGRITTMLTAGTTAGTAVIQASVYDGRVVVSPCPVPPVLTASTTVELKPADLYITKSASPSSINQGEMVTYTLTYGNLGDILATNVRITDTLPVGFLYVRSSSTPNREPPSFEPPRKWSWNIGNLAPGATGTIKLVARPDASLLWCSPVNRSNSAEISSDVPDLIGGNNVDSAVVGIVVPTSVDVSANPTSIQVSNGTKTTAIRVEVRDSNGHLVHNVPVELVATDGIFLASGSSTHTVTTIYGIATASLASSPTVGTVTVSAEVLPACGGMPTDSVNVEFVPGFPDTIESVVLPTLVRLCGGEAVVTATVKDAFGNLVSDGTEVNFNVVQGERGDMHPRLTSTVDGVATSTLRTKGFLFGPRYLDVYILARRETQQATDLLKVDLEEGLASSVTLSSTPPVLQVGGYQAQIKAIVLDCGGNKVQDGTVVTFTASGLGTITPTVTTTLNGAALSTFTSGCTMGNVAITAKANSATGSMTLRLEPGPADLISVAAPVPATIRNCSGQATVEATVYDVCGNLVKDGTLVLFTPQYGYVRASPSLKATVNGKASTTLIALDKPLDTWPLALEQIDVTSGSAFPGFANLNIRPGLPEDVALSADPGSIPINGDANGYDIIVEAQVSDCSGTPVEDGTPVLLETELGFFWESGMRQMAGNTVNGIVTGTLTSQSVAGTVPLTATANSAVGYTAVRFLPDEPWLIEVWGYPTTIPANGRSVSLITALVKDAYQNPVLDGITMTFVTDYGHFVESGDVVHTTYTNADGYVFANLVSDDVPRTALVRAIAYNSRQGYSYVFMVAPAEMKYVYLPAVIRLDRAP